MQNKPYFFFLETGVPKRGGGGVRHLGKIPKKSRFFLGGVPKWDDDFTVNSVKVKIIWVVFGPEYIGWVWEGDLSYWTKWYFSPGIN